MRFQAAVAIIGLVISVCACGSAGPTAPGVPATAGDLKSSLSTSFDALTIPAQRRMLDIHQPGRASTSRTRARTDCSGTPGVR